jgi:hypothetical protein
MPDASAPNPYVSYPTVTNKLMPPPDPMQAMGQTVGVANGITGLQRQQFDLAHQQLNATNQIFGAIATDPRPETVANGAAALRNLGVPANMIATELGNVSGFVNDPQKLKQWAFDHISRNMSVQEQMQAGGMAAPSLVSNGQEQVPTNTQSGLQPAITRAAGAPIPILQSRSELASPATVQAPNGQTVQVTQRQRQAIVGDPAQMGSTAPAQPKMAGLPTAAPGNEQGIAALSGDLNAASGKIAGTRDLQKAIQLADQLGPNATGPSADAEARVKEFLVTRGVIKPNDTNVVPRQELAKYLARYAANSPNAARSDAAQAATYASSPNITQSLPAISELAKNAIASDRMDAALPNAFPKDGSGADYLRHKSTFMQQQDQAAYRFDFLPPQQQQAEYAKQRSAYTNGTPAEKAAAGKFLKSLQTAHSTIFSAGGADGQ